MYGSASKQARHLLSYLRGIGRSKKTARETSGLTGQRGQQISNRIHSHKYQRDCLNTFRELIRFAKDRHGIKDSTRITPGVLHGYTQQKIDSGCTYRTISTYLGRIRHIHTAVEIHNRQRGQTTETFTPQDIWQARERARELAGASNHANRAYISPRAILGRLTGRCRVAGRLQYEAGLRVAEATRIKKWQLAGSSTLRINAKGGVKLEKKIAPELYAEIARDIRTKGEFRLEPRTFRNHLKAAAEKAGQKYTGSHGLRYCYAQKKFLEYQDRGMSRDRALKATSEDLGHHRPEITEHYLR